MEPTIDDLERMIEQASLGDWVQEAYLQGLAADFLDKGEALPLPLRAYIATSLREAAEPVNAEVREYGLLARDITTRCLRCLNGARFPGPTGAEVARETVAEFAAKTIRGIRQLPGKLGLGRRLPETLRDLESTMVWVLFQLEYREDGFDFQKRRPWEEASAEVSERLDPDREACGEQGPPRMSGYSPRSIASLLKRFNSLGRRQART